ncbi:ABC transporter substrate-binding protein [Bacillaceae bacterium W0354]
MKKGFIMFLFSALIALTACSSDDTLDEIVLADAGWDSIRFHNSVMQIIIEHGYDFDTSVMTGTTANTVQGLREGDINVYSEIWTDNIKEVYEEAIDKGEIIKTSVNFDDNTQGLYVPTYVIEGDPERGIEPLAPDLKTVEDLAKYPQVFKDPEDSSKGRIVNAPTSWVVSGQIQTKVENYGLDEHFNVISPGSDSAAVASLVAAYEKGEAWVGYYWSPTWVTAQYDLTLLEEAPYDPEIWEESLGTEFPPNDVVVAVHSDFPEQAPEVYEFLQNYETSTKLTEEALMYMLEHEADADEAAEWWMKENQDIWTKWVPEDVADKVKKGLGL